MVGERETGEDYLRNKLEVLSSSLNELIFEGGERKEKGRGSVAESLSLDLDLDL